MVEPKQRPVSKPVRTVDKARVPRVAMHAVWLRTRDSARQFMADDYKDGKYQESAVQEERAQDTVSYMTESAAGVAWRGGKKLAQQVAQKCQTGKGTKQATQHGMQARSTLVKPNKPSAGTSPNRGTRTAKKWMRADRKKTDNLLQRRLQQDSKTLFKPITHKQLRKRLPTKAARDINQVHKKAAGAVQGAERAAKTAGKTIKKLAEAIIARVKSLWATTQTMVAVISAGVTAVLIIVVICTIALMMGSAFGIFFTRESVGSGISIQEAITQLNGEYQDRLEEIETSVPHDRQEIESNDGSYAIAWQDVLTVFAARTSGAEDGATVAVIDFTNLERLREIMWDMNEVNYRTDTRTHDVEVPDEEGGVSTTTVTETVLTLELTHKTVEEMRTEYTFNDRQNEYLTLLSNRDTSELWGELIGAFFSGRGEILSPAVGWQPTGSLQWPLTITGTITSQFGYRTDPISGESSYHSGTDIAAPEGSPILSAADGVVVVANALDSWGGSYGYYVKIDHGNGIETLYAHCSAICVSVGQQVQAGQVIGYVGQTGRATGSHLHFELYQGGQRGDVMAFFTSGVIS